ncbi:MAG: SDR family oxidoreductase [Actinobacteria bacterium]|nr:SDR family oxidoreductase [Actinomycetota bacterium]
MSAARPVALVTGASSGIGEAFAIALAQRGHDVVVVARRADVLGDLATRLRTDSGAEVEVLAADLATDAGVAAVAERLGDPNRPVDLLVNNAGVGTMGRFWELPVEKEAAEVALNVVAVMRLTHAALGPMVGRGRGGVINVSSISAYQPIPRHATYGATKAFVSSFTNAVHEELRGTGVKAMVLAPGYTRTGFQADGFDPKGLPEMVWQQPDEVVAGALKAYDRGRAVCVTGAINVATVAATSVLPAGITRKVAGALTRRAY